MRVDLSNTSASQLDNSPSSQQVNAGSASSVGGAEDRATLTSGEGSVSSLVSTAMASPEIREDKVASLQQAIGNGEYELDPAKIAASMINEYA
jgi:flagellar biosynthesis anti-sigma factor FlgM